MKKIKKLLKTIEENSKGKNIKTIDTETKKIIKNVDLEKLAGKGKLPGYEEVKPKIIAPYLRSKKDNIKKNNLDPKIAIIKPRKIGSKAIIRKPSKII